MSEHGQNTPEIYAKNIFPAPEDISQKLDQEANSFNQQEKQELRGLETVWIKGEQEMGSFNRGKEIMIYKKTKSLNGLEGVAVTGDDGVHTINFTTDSGEKISIFYPEKRLAAEGGPSYSGAEAQAKFKSEWAQLPEKFRQAYEDYVNWIRNPHTGIDLDVLEDTKKIEPYWANQIRNFAKNPNMVVLGAKDTDYFREAKFYWAVVPKK